MCMDGIVVLQLHGVESHGLNGSAGELQLYT
jgi:hypothetical protein